MRFFCSITGHFGKLKCSVKVHQLLLSFRWEMHLDFEKAAAHLLKNFGSKIKENELEAIDYHNALLKLHDVNVPHFNKKIRTFLGEFVALIGTQIIFLSILRT